MKRTVLTLGLLAMLAACGDGEPLFDDDDGDGGGDGGEVEPGFSDTGGAGTVPAAIAGNLTNVKWNEADDTLAVTIDSLDTTPVTATYARNEALDLPGYTAFSMQEDPLDRMFVALVRNSGDGAAQGGVVADGGQFNRVFGGAFYRRTDDYTPHEPTQPDNGLVSYAGDYAGLSNTGPALPVPGGDPSLAPREPDQVTGQVFLNADFSDNTVNGAIYDRSAESGLELGDVILVVTDITEEGTFGGTAEDRPDEGTATAIGTYAGAFGGKGATSVAGVINISDYQDDVDNEIEWGSFVLDQCGRPTDSDICDLVRPDAP